MLLSQAILAELQYESTNTRKVLDRVPSEHFTWKPHEKSFPIGRLAGHVAELPRFVALIVNNDELDLAAMNLKTPGMTTPSELMQSFEDHLTRANEALQNNITDEVMLKKWTLRYGDKVLFALPKTVALRSMVFNHIIHHRAQLGVYLRLLDIPVPAIYGPTADEQPF